MELFFAGDIFPLDFSSKRLTLFHSVDAMYKHAVYNTRYR